MEIMSMEKTPANLMNRRFIWHVLKGRWMMMVVSLYILAFAGGPYVFGIYSQVIKSELQYDEETIESLSFFKDLGNNVGILSGLLNEILPAWVVLAVGSFMNLFGFVMMWLAVTHRIARPPLWQMYLYMTIGSNSMSFFNTGVVVTCVKNFPESRGEVLGLVKGVIGLSTAILTQIYHALYAQNTEGMILLLGWLPSLVTFVCMFLVRPMKPVEDKKEGKHFFSFLYLALFLAGFLMLIIIVENQVHLTPVAYKPIAVAILLLVVLNVVIAIRAERDAVQARQESDGSCHKDLNDDFMVKPSSKKHAVVYDDGICAMKNQASVAGGGGDSQAPKGGAHQAKGEMAAGDSDNAAKSVRSNNITASLSVTKESHGDELHKQNDTNGNTKRSSAAMEAGHGGEGAAAAAGFYARAMRKAARFYRRWPKRGDDFSIPHALLSLDMWIVFVTAVCGIGATLTAIDSVGQIGQSLGYSEVGISTCVSLISIWNFLGRIASGYLSETLLRRYRLPRTLLLMVVVGLSCAGHLLIAFPVKGALYIASIVEGLTFGAQWPLLFAIISELFGLKYYATLYNVAPLAAPLGSYLMKVRVSGFLYDREAAAQELLLQGRAAGAGSSGHEVVCIGPSCFRLAFLIMTFISALGTIIAGWLVLRTRRFYRHPRPAPSDHEGAADLENAAK